MKAISLWQPWAFLVAAGEKKIETRSFRTKHRGPIAIHAAKKWNLTLRDMCSEDPFFEILSRYRPNYGGCRDFDVALDRILFFGAIVAVGKLTDCVEITTENVPAGVERSLGDYTPGRFMWKFDEVVQLMTPMPYRGQQGFFNVDI